MANIMKYCKIKIIGYNNIFFDNPIPPIIINPSIIIDEIKKFIVSAVTIEIGIISRGK